MAIPILNQKNMCTFQQKARIPGEKNSHFFRWIILQQFSLAILNPKRATSIHHEAGKNLQSDLDHLNH